MPPLWPPPTCMDDEVAEYMPGGADVCAMPLLAWAGGGRMGMPVDTGADDSVATELEEPGADPRPPLWRDGRGAKAGESAWSMSDSPLERPVDEWPPLAAPPDTPGPPPPDAAPRSPARGPHTRPPDAAEAGGAPKAFESPPNSEEKGKLNPELLPPPLPPPLAALLLVLPPKPSPRSDDPEAATGPPRPPKPPSPRPGAPARPLEVPATPPAPSDDAGADGRRGGSGCAPNGSDEPPKPPIPRPPIGAPPMEPTLAPMGAPDRKPPPLWPMAVPPSALGPEAPRVRDSGLRRADGPDPGADKPIVSPATADVERPGVPSARRPDDADGAAPSDAACDEAVGAAEWERAGRPG